MTSSHLDTMNRAQIEIDRLTRLIDAAPESGIVLHNDQHNPLMANSDLEPRIIQLLTAYRDELKAEFDAL